MIDIGDDLLVGADAIAVFLFKTTTKRKCVFYAIAVRESHEPYGEQCHILAHVPPDFQAAFEEHARDFLRGNLRHQSKALKCKPLYYGLGELV